VTSEQQKQLPFRVHAPYGDHAPINRNRLLIAQQNPNLHILKVNGNPVDQPVVNVKFGVKIHTSTGEVGPFTHADGGEASREMKILQDPFGEGICIIPLLVAIRENEDTTGSVW
jgi:hypothetical protein